MAFDPYADAFTARDWETPVDGTLRFAVIGLGWFGRDEAIPAIVESDYGVPTVVASSSKPKAERVAADHETIEYGLTYNEFHAGEAAAAYDAVYIATPNALHLQYVETAAELGKHVLCEKPIEANSDRAASMIEVCDAADVTLMIAYRMHTEPVTRRVRDLVATGFVGDVVQVDGAHCAPLLHRGDPDQWRFDPDLAGGGALYDIGIYPLNTARFVLDADPTVVEATVVPNEAILDGMDVHASFHLTFPGDVVASCRTSYDTYETSYIEVLGTDGRLRIEPAFTIAPERTLTVERDDVHTAVSIQTNELIEEFDYFANAVLADRTVTPDGEHGLVDMRIMEAVYASDETGQRIEL